MATLQGAEGRAKPSQSAQPPKRRLAAVLCADVEGFSRLCGLDEAGTLAVLRRHVEELIKPTIRANKGRVTNMAGDEILAEFGSAVAAVQAAIAIQQGMRERNDGLDAAQVVRFRIGLNLSEIIVQDREIFGDGVNIAARTQAMAEPGAIWATEAVIQQVRGKISAEITSMGKLELKNIAEPVHLYRIAELPPAGQDARGPARRSSVSASPKPSIAVLPFTNLSHDPEQTYFSDGLAEDLITDLSRFRTISVIARNSSFVYRGQHVDVRRVGQDLGVRFVVEGSVRKMQDSVRINVQLVNAETRHHVWAERYDALLSDLFRLQDEIIRRIAGSLVPRMEDESLAIARRQPTELLQAYDYFLRGKALLYAATDAAGMEEARKLFVRAIEIDPTFASPHCYVVRILNNMTMYISPGRPLDPFREEAWRHARAAAALDDSDPHTHICLAWCHLWRHRFEQARTHLEAAERLNPYDPDRAMDRGTGWVFLGEVDRGIECMLTGMRLNPHHPPSYVADLAEAYFVARRYRDMLQLLERIPDQSLLTPAWRAAGYALAGDLGRGRAEAARWVSLVRAEWAGDPDAGPADYVRWAMSFNPFCRPDDREHMLRGLQLAGLPGLDVPSSEPPV